jgi:hypothetical protein
MTSFRLWMVVMFALAFASCTPIPFSSGDKPGTRPFIPVPQLYRSLPLQEIPTNIAENVILTNEEGRARYGYFINRPVARLFRGVLGRFLLKFMTKILSSMPPLLHWAILISDEPPDTVANPSQENLIKVPSPKTGLVFELRNSMQTGLIYLDVQNWTSYMHRAEEAKYLGTLNRTDDGLMAIGRALIKEIGRDGFHNVYRNCQHFTTWYIKELWPDIPSVSARADQLLGKLLWWPRDWKKTVKWGTNKIKGWIGLNVENMEELDSKTHFAGLGWVAQTKTRSTAGDSKPMQTWQGVSLTNAKEKLLMD